MKQRTQPGTSRRGITALAAGLALLLSGSSMPSEPEGSLPPLSGASATSGSAGDRLESGALMGLGVDYETVQAATQSALTRCGVQSCPSGHDVHETVRGLRGRPDSGQHDLRVGEDEQL